MEKTNIARHKSVPNKATTIVYRGLTVMLVCIVLIITCSIILLTEGQALISSQPPHFADTIIVLGWPANSDGSPSEVMKMRVGKAVKLFESKFAPIVIFSGSAVANTHVEAEVMAKYAIELGLPRNSIIMETNSTDTLENALFSKQILDANNLSSAIVVTSPYHTLRAQRDFAVADLNVIMVSAIEPGKLTILERLREISHENCAFIYNFLKNL